MVGEQELYARILDAPWSGYKTKITVGGAGGLGSWLSLFLSRIGHTLDIYDFDVVGVENIGGGQFYSQSQAGMSKTDALMSNINTFAGSRQINGFPKYEKGNQVQPLTFTTFDNMEARKDMLETWLDLVKKKSKNDDQLYAFINLSMLAEGGFIEVIDRPSRAKTWLKEWVPSHEMPDLACTFKSTTHNAALIASYGVSILNNLIFNKIQGEEFRYVPYKTIVDLNLIMLESYDK